MIKAKDFQELLEWNKTREFAQWLADYVRNHTFEKLDLVNGYFMLDKGIIDAKTCYPSGSEIPDEFLSYATENVGGLKADYIYRQLDTKSTRIFKDLGWQIHDGYARNIIIHFNSIAYTDTEKLRLRAKYITTDISPLINLHDNLFKQFNLPEPDLDEFGEWFHDVALKHKDNLTDKEKSSQSFDLTEEELNKNYVCKNVYGNCWFYFPYREYLEDNGWKVDGTTISWSQL